MDRGFRNVGADLWGTTVTWWELRRHPEASSHIEM